ncbi:hypothetical protein AB0J63_18010 [Streptosporangium canum]|uniref:hypothetical protein n=1 Tax=Streptosporangium canum TaxID=324952 RepID=UPI0034136065
MRITTKQNSTMITAVERCRTSVRRRAYALSDATSWSLVMRLAPVPPTALRVTAMAAARSAPDSSEM